MMAKPEIFPIFFLRPTFDPELLPMGLGVVPLETLEPNRMLIVVKVGLGGHLDEIKSGFLSEVSVIRNS